MGKIEDDLLNGLEAHRSGRLDVAEEVYRSVLLASPGNASALHLLGVVSHQRGNSDAGAKLIRQAIKAVPNNPAFWNNLGEALRGADKPREAIEAYRSAIKFRANYSEAYNNLGNAFGQLNMPVEAAGALRKAIEFAPDDPEPHWNLAMALLVAGQFDEGWREFEWRLKKPSANAPAFPQPLWLGEELRGRRLLLWGEQGFGDMVQFVRYLPRVREIAKASGAKIYLAVHGELVSWFTGQDLADEIVPAGVGLPEFDVHAAVMSLPLIFKTTVATIPNAVPYLRAPDDRIEYWRSQLPSVGKLKVGIAWAGRPAHENDRRRSMHGRYFEPLTKMEGVHCVTVQPRLTELPKELKATDSGLSLKDFADTAGLIANLDLVVTVDTSVAHVAGAMGKRVWVLLPFAPDWRWMLEREDSPWYPTMRLFRQKAIGDWTGVIGRVAGEIRAICCEKYSGS